MKALIAASLLLRGVVDQMDTGVVAIEWSDESISYVPISSLPAKTVEGDTVVLRIRPIRLRRASRAQLVARNRGRHKKMPVQRASGENHEH
jgi:hypothetical protein